MFSFVRFLLLISLFSSVFALPLAESQVIQRDVVDPPITSPDSNTVWHVGDEVTVTWSTANLPVNQTNPIGKLVLGYQYNSSENLMLDSPLATNINYSVGQVQITVPNVPSRTDYIVVLFGDSGNASPKFTIINDASSSTSAQASPPVSSSSPDQSPTDSTPISTPPANPSTSASADGGTTGSTVGGLATTPTTSSSHTTSSASSSVVTATSSATPTSTQSSAAWQKHIPGLGTSVSIALTLIYFGFS